MASECCGNCRYCEYKNPNEKHLGSPTDKPDWYCWMYQQFLGNPSGKCKKYEEK
jgi:hypothetical protein